MTIQEIRYFLAVVDTGSFTLAAKGLGISQPSLSQQINQLERSLGQRLLDRLPRKVLLTAAGQAVLSQARQALHAFDGLRNSLDKQSSIVSGTLTVAATSMLAPFIVADAVARFTKQYPAVDLSLHELSAPRILAEIKDGKCDVGIIGIGTDDPQILLEPLFSESLIVSMRKRHKFASRSGLSLEDLKGESMILIDELKDITAPLLAAQSLSRPRGQINGTGLQLATIEALVASGAGICLLPAMARNAHNRGILYRPIR